MELTPDWIEFIECLQENQVDFLVVGAFAMGFHSLPRMTGDIDFWVRPDEKNSIRSWQAINDFGLGVIGFDPLDLANGKTLIMGVPPGRIDLLPEISGVDFEFAWSRKVEGVLQGLTVFFISEADLLTNKRSTGRLKDAVDVERLEKRMKRRQP